MIKFAGDVPQVRKHTVCIQSASGPDTSGIPGPCLAANVNSFPGGAVGHVVMITGSM